MRKDFVLGALEFHQITEVDCFSSESQNDFAAQDFVIRTLRDYLVKGAASIVRQNSKEFFCVSDTASCCCYLIYSECDLQDDFRGSRRL